MATNLEKLQSNKPATPIEIMETDHDNINLSRDQFEAKYRKKKEIAAKVAAEKVRLEEEAAREEEELQKVGSEDNSVSGKEVKKVQEEE